VSPYYDSLVAKLIVWAPDRPAAMDRMLRALGEFQISGPGMKTTLGFHRRILNHPAFRSGEFSTDFVERHMST
jgi:acetyl-CoA carboxylase biotin carboxylase subunit